MPAQPFAVGVTVIVPEIGAPVALVAIKAPILPEPEAPSPMAGLLFVQLYVAVPIDPEKLTAAVKAFAHRVWLVTALTVGRGLTVIVNVIGVPVQPFKLGVTVMVDVIGAPVALVAVKMECYLIQKHPIRLQYYC